MSEVIIIKTGVANLASMCAAWRRLGSEPVVTDDPERIWRARHVVLPGVGAFGPAIRNLNQSGLSEVLQERISQDLPLLGVCLGAQLLCESSEEGRVDTRMLGLGMIPGSVTLFDTPALCVPHFGWTEVSPTAKSRFLCRGYAYYANSYKLDVLPLGWQGAYSMYGKPFVAAVERGSLLACQFHPELSGAWGSELLNNWKELTC